MKRKSALIAIVLGVVASIAFGAAHATTQAMTLQAGVAAQPIPDPLPIAVIGLAVIGVAIAARRRSERRSIKSFIVNAGFTCVLAFVAVDASAVPVQFDYTGANGLVTATGSLIIDDSLFNGTAFQPIGQSNLINFSMTMTNASTSFTWGLADLVAASSWFFDSTTAVPDIVGQGGYVSLINALIAAGTGNLNSTLGSIANNQGDWIYVGEAVTVPEPHGLLVLGAGLVGMAVARFRSTSRTA
jgi:hypothetical protein